MKNIASELVRVAKELMAVGQETLLATNSSHWRWDYDASDTTASVYLDERENLRMEIVNVHTKSGLGAGERKTVLEDVSIGTLTKPKLGLIQGLLKKNGHERSSAGGPFPRTWISAQSTGGRLPLSEIIANKAVEWGVQAAPAVPAADPRQRKELLMKFVQSMTPEEVEKAFAAVLGKR